MNPVPTVFIIDDDNAIRRAIGRLIASVGWQVATFKSAEEYLEQFNPHKPGCMVLDVRMPGLSGLDLQLQLQSGDGAPPSIVFISGHGDIPMCARALKSGAIDFLQKPFNDQDLLDAVSRAIETDKNKRHEHAHYLEIRERTQLLTRRERQVFELVTTGLTNRQTADELGTSEKTIKVHRARVMRKMQADSLAELVLMAQTIEGHTPKALPG